MEVDDEEMLFVLPLLCLQYTLKWFCSNYYFDKRINHSSLFGRSSGINLALEANSIALLFL